MNTRKTIRKILFIGMWLAIGTGMTVLLLAAIGKQKKESCKDYSISIKGVEGEQLFLTNSDVVGMIKFAMHGNIKGQLRKSFDLKKIEQLLEQNVWIKEARAYFDNQDVLKVSIREREPLARIFTVGGKSFYLDADAKLLQLSDKVSARLPVFTGYPDRKNYGASDSTLKQDIIGTARYISTHSFWNAQVSQLDIVNAGPDGWEFDMIPLVGNHLVKLGDGKNIDQKFDRLFTFYKEVLSKSGFDKYKSLDVRYAGQIVAAKSENPKVDQAKLKKSVETLLRQIKEAEIQSDVEASKAIIADDKPAKENKVKVEPTGPLPNAVEIPESTQSTDAEKTDKLDIPKQNVKAGIKENKTPRAVMPKKPN